TVANAPWLTVTPSSGTMPSTLRITADPSSLTAGTRTGTITISAPNTSTGSRTITVNFTLTASGFPSLALKPSSMVFSFVRGGAAKTQPFSVVNQGGGTLPCAFSVSTNTGDKWLKVLTNTVSVGPFGSASVNATADPSGLAVGTYSGTIITS